MEGILQDVSFSLVAKIQAILVIWLVGSSIRDEMDSSTQSDLEFRIHRV